MVRKITGKKVFPSIKQLKKDGNNITIHTNTYTYYDTNIKKKGMYFGNIEDISPSGGNLLFQCFTEKKR